MQEEKVFRGKRRSENATTLCPLWKVSVSRQRVSPSSAPFLALDLARSADSDQGPLRDQRDQLACRRAAAGSVHNPHCRRSQQMLAQRITFASADKTSPGA